MLCHMRMMATSQREDWSFPSPPVLDQSIAKLLEKVRNGDKTDGQLMNAVKVLLDGCQDRNAFVSDCCCSGLVQLVRAGCLEMGDAITRLLNVIPSAWCFMYCVRAVVALLVDEVSTTFEQTGSYTCPYTTRFHAHPLISLVSCHADTWRLLQMEIERVFHVVAPRLCPSLLIMLQPFLKHQLLDSRLMSTSLMSTNSVYASLLHIADNLVLRSKEETKERNKADLEDAAIKLTLFLVKSLSFLQTKALAETILNFQLVANWFLASTLSDDMDSMVDSVLLTAINLSCEAQAEGLSVQPLIRIAVNIARQNRGHNWHVCLTGVVFLLLSAAPTDRLELLELCKMLIQLVILTQSSSAQLRCVLSIAVYPVLQIAVCDGRCSRAILGHHVSHACQSLAEEIICALESCIHAAPPHEMVAGCQHEISVPGSVVRTLAACCHLSQQLLQSEGLATQWLASLKTKTSDGIPASQFVTLVVASLFVAGNEIVRTATISIFTQLAAREPSQALYVLNLILYQLKLETDSSMKLQLLCMISQLATHKLCIPAVMKILQNLASNERLQPLAVRLMCKLWEKQDRVFPYVLRVMTASSMGEDSHGQHLDLKIAQAACIRDICQLRASQHGSDLLGVMSKILNDVSSNVSSSPEPAALVLESLKFLCEEEVLDLETAWSMLAGKLKNDERPLLLCQLCSLLELASDQCVSSESEKFKDDAVASLCQWSQHENPVVSNAAYKSLCHFALDDLKFNLLPVKVQQLVLQRVSKSLAAELMKETDEDGILPNIPGAAIVCMLEKLPTGASSGFIQFLTSMLDKELDGLPRGIVRSAQRSAAISGPLRILAGIPSHLEQIYEKPGRPGLSKHIAAGLLLCVSALAELEMSQSLDGTKWRRLSQKFTRNVSNFANEISVLPSDWLKVPVIVSGWMSFMETAVRVLLDGRCVELHELDVDKSKVTAEERVHEALPWVRDQIVEQLQFLSKGTPGVQANSLYALCGLAHSLLGPLLDDKLQASATQHLSSTRTMNVSWLSRVADTLMVILDSNHEPQEEILDFCRAGYSKAVSAMARAASALCLSELSQLLLRHCYSKFQSAVGLLVKFARRKKRETPGGIPEESDSGQLSSPVRSSCGFALGVIVDRLTSEGGEGEIKQVLETVVKTLRASAFDDHNCGSVLAVSALVKMMAKKVGGGLDGAKQLWLDLKQLLVGAKVDHMVSECCCIAFSSALLHLYCSNVLSDDEAVQSLATVTQLQKCHPEVSCFSASLGALIYGLASWGLSDVVDTGKELIQQWLSSISIDSASDTWVPLAWGLAGLFGCSSHISADNSVSRRNIFDTSLLDYVKLLKKLASSSKSETCSHAAWFIGLLASTAGREHSASAVPTSYDYLPEMSIVRSVYEWLSATAQTVSVLPPDNHLNVVLSSVANVSKQLPPVDWDSLLSVFVRSHFDSASTGPATEMCLKFAAAHSTSGNMLSFVKSSLSQQKFNLLPVSCRRILLSCLPDCVMAMPCSQLETVVSEILLPVFTGKIDSSSDLRCQVLLALSSSLQIKESLLPRALQVVCNTVVRLFNLLVHHSDNLIFQCMETVAKCLAHLPIDVLQQVLTPSSLDLDEHVAARIYSVASLLVEQHQFSLSWLEQPISYLLSKSYHHKQNLPASLMMALDHALAAVWKRSYDLSAAGQHVDIVVWSLELMGYVRSLTEADNTMPYQTMRVVLLLLCQAWSASACPDIGSLQPHKAVLTDLTILPSVLCRLIAGRSWNTSLETLASWLCWAKSACTELSELSFVFEGCFHELRHHELYRWVLPTIDLLW